MTDRSEHRRRRPSAWPIVLASIALFAVCFTLLASQLTTGQGGGLRAAPRGHGQVKSASATFSTAAPTPVTTSSS